jgi:ABC-type sugar transport system ATPase subunit
MPDTILEMTGITKVFAGVQALKNVRFTLQKGEVHALMGENGAGKSTLMKLLIGMYMPEKGVIKYLGKAVQFKNTAEALNSGISMIHQELSLVQRMDVAENIWLGREKLFTTAGFLINTKKRYEKTKELLNKLGIKINPADIVKDLSVAQMQLVELARAVSYESNIIIMDEPTSALTTREIDLLYKIIRQVVAKGVVVVFISHKLEEVFQICDKVTVLRDGNYIDTTDIKDLTLDALIKMVVGREIREMFAKSIVPFRDEAIRIENLTGPTGFFKINFSMSTS